MMKVIKEVWRDFRTKILALSKENYIVKGKQIARELQLCIERNQRDVIKIIHLVCERASKDLHAYPIAALLFEDLGNEVENSYGGEVVLNELQKQLQKSLSALKTKLGNMEKLLGTDVGIVFLFFCLLKLENLRSGDGGFFKGLLVKLFKEFHFYMLGAAKWPYKDFSPSVLSAFCMLMCLVAKETNDPKEKLKTKHILGRIRNFYIHGDLRSIGKVQVQWAIESLSSSQCSNERNDFYKKKYTVACQKSSYLIDSMDDILSDINVEKITTHEVLVKKAGMPEVKPIDIDVMNLSDESGDVFINEDEQEDSSHSGSSQSVQLVALESAPLRKSSVCLAEESKSIRENLDTQSCPEPCSDLVQGGASKPSTSKRDLKESVSSTALQKLIDIG